MQDYDTTYTRLSDADDAWSRNPFAIGVLRTFDTVSEAVSFAMRTGLRMEEQQDVRKELLEIQRDDPSRIYGNKDIKLIPEYVMQATRKYVDAAAINDTSVGGNDALNCHWQFNIDDDIIHPLHATSDDLSTGLGRVYQETYQATQRILWLRFGTPHFSGLKDFYSADTNGVTMSRLMNTGNDSALYLVTKTIFSGLKLAIMLPFVPITALFNVLGNIDNMPITKYYQFRPRMHLYYLMVNDMLANLAVGIGIYRSGKIADFVKMADSSWLPSNVVDQLAAGGTPLVLKDGPDIFTILAKRARSKAGDKGFNANNPYTIKQLIERSRGDVQGGHTGEVWDRFSTAISDTYQAAKDTAFDAHQYVGFRLEKGADVSETVSNSSGESSVAQALNAKASSARDKVFSVQAGKTGSIIDGVTEAGKDIAAAAVDSIGAGKVVDILTGSSHIEIPEVWKSSSFSRSYSFDLQLRARYGDPVSIYQSIYIPLCLILAGALPRGTGTNMYTSPFLVEAYVQGMYALPLGMIESVSIKRGLAEHGWGYHGLPLAVDISLNIKDLSPAFFLTMSTGDGGIIDNMKSLLTTGADLLTLGVFKTAYSANTTMQNYLNTLSGIGLADMIYGAAARMRRVEVATLIAKGTMFNPHFIGSDIGNNRLVRAAANLSLGGWKAPNPN